MADGDRVAGIYSEIKYKFDRRSIQNLRKFKRDLMELKNNLRSVQQMSRKNVKIGFTANNAKVSKQVAKAQKETAKASKDQVDRSAKVWRMKEKILKTQQREARVAKQAAEARSRQSVDRSSRVWKQKERILKEQERQSQAEVSRAGKVYKQRQKITREMARQKKLSGNAMRSERDIQDRMARNQAKLGRISDQSDGRVTERNLRAAQRAQERYNRKLRDGIITMGQYNRASQNVTEGLRRQGRAAKNTTMSFDRMRTSLAGATGAFSGFAGAVGIGAIGGQFESVQIMLETAMGAEDAASTMEFLIEQSQRLGVGAIETSKGFARYAIAGRKMGFTNEQLREQFLGVAEAATTFGLRQEEITGVIRSLEQMA